MQSCRFTVQEMLCQGAYHGLREEGWFFQVVNRGAGQPSPGSDHLLYNLSQGDSTSGRPSCSQAANKLAPMHSLFLCADKLTHLNRTANLATVRCGHAVSCGPASDKREVADTAL